jgi:hypothetical protein
MPTVEIVGHKLGGDAAPGKAQPRADHRDRGGPPPERGQQVRGHGQRPEPHEHERQRQAVAVAGAVWRRRHRDPDDACDDHGHRHLLTAAGALAEHALGREHQHEQPERQRRLHHHQRRPPQCNDLQRPTQDRHRCAA